MSKARIIVVEDEGLVALQIQEGLMSAGYDVPGIAASALEAMKLISDTEPDLVLMDIHLKGAMDGVQAAMKIREMYDIPVIYLTAYSDNATVERAKETEPYGYILKPVSERSLELAIEMTLQKAEKAKELKNTATWYSSILNGIGQGILVISLKGTVQFINPYGESLTGWSYLTAKGKLYKEVCPFYTFDTKEPMEIPFDDIILENKMINNKFCLLRTAHHIEISLTYSLIPLQNQNRTTIGIIILFSPSEKDKGDSMVVKEEESPELPVSHSVPLAKGDKKQGITVEWYRKTDDTLREPSFNVIDLGDDYIGYYIFDVSCYGLTAGLFAHNLNQYLQPDIDLGGLLTRKEQDGNIIIVSPGDVIRELNRRFFFEEKDNPFFTIIYGITHRKTGKSIIVRAGHPYPIYQNQEGHLILFKSEGGAVGMFSELQVAEYEFTFEPGTRLYLYSDGIIDSSFADMNHDSFMRLISFIENHQDSSLREFIAALEQDEKKWHNGCNKPQDATLIVLEREE